MFAKKHLLSFAFSVVNNLHIKHIVTVAYLHTVTGDTVIKLDNLFVLLQLVQVLTVWDLVLSLFDLLVEWLQTGWHYILYLPALSPFPPYSHPSPKIIASHQYLNLFPHPHIILIPTTFLSYSNISTTFPLHLRHNSTTFPHLPTVPHSHNTPSLKPSHKSLILILL